MLSWTTVSEKLRGLTLAKGGGVSCLVMLSKLGIRHLMTAPKLSYLHTITYLLTYVEIEM